MVPDVLSALVLTTSSLLLMSWGVIHQPFINVLWTTPPNIGHYLVTGGDWRAAVWGGVSLATAMGIYCQSAGAGRARPRQDGRGLSARRIAPVAGITSAPAATYRLGGCLKQV